MVKYLPALWATRDRSLSLEDPLEKEVAPHSSNLAWRTHGQRSWRAAVHGLTELDTREQLTHKHPPLFSARLGKMKAVSTARVALGESL